MILSDQSSTSISVDWEVQAGNLNILTQISMNLCESVKLAEIKRIPVFKVMHVMTFLLPENILYFVSWILTMMSISQRKTFKT